jgi:hypothetical protein
MSDHSRVFPPIVLLLAAAACLIAACGDRDTIEKVPVSDLPDQTQNVERTKVYPQITLQPQFEQGHETDSVLFRSIFSLDVDSKGRIYAADAGAHGVHLFSAAGDYVMTVGKEGAGPGEFNLLAAAQVDAHDSLFVYDLALRRLSVYAPDRFEEPQYTTFIPSVSGFGRSEGIPMRVFPLARGHRLVQYTEPNQPGRPAEIREESMLGVVDNSGQLVQEVFRAPKPESFYARFKGGGTMFTRMPFGREPAFALSSQDRLFYGWTDSLSIGVFTLDGDEISRISKPHRSIGLTPTTRDAFLASAPEGTPFTDSSIEEHTPLPETWPAFSQFVDDDSGHLWVKPILSEDGEESVWWVFNVETGRQVASAVLPGDVSLYVIRDGRAYGVKSDAMDVETLVVYEVQEPSAL